MSSRRAKELLLLLDEMPGASLAKRIALAIQKAILDGRLRPGTLLPGSRPLAEMFDVNRFTVIHAIEDLEREGWVRTVVARGTFVADHPPSGEFQGPRETELPEDRLGFDFPSFLRPASVLPSGAISLSDGAADPRLAPAEVLSRSYQRALRLHSDRLLKEPDPRGTPLLREEIARWISERHGVSVDPTRILVSRGSRGALALLSVALLRPGEAVAVENPGNRAAWDILRHGAKLVLHPVPVDADGMDPDALEALMAREPIRMVYLTPRRQFPTTCVLSRERSRRILEVAARYRAAILEDDYDGEISYSHQADPPLLAQDTVGQVLHLGSLSRLLAPGLRLGYLVLPAPLAPFLVKVRGTHQEQGDPAFEWAVADLMRGGELAAHVRRSRKTYEVRRDFLIDLLRMRLGSVLQVEVPGGGMGLWLRLNPGVDGEAWLRRARSEGVVLNPPSAYYLGAPSSCFRMGFTQANEMELELAVTRLVKALP